jgi:putative nucleotidyltransferase with HDIG domain
VVTPSEPLVSTDLYRKKALRALGELPPFSPILNRLLASIANDDISFGKIADLIEKDAVVAGNILHLVNSALYARRGTINSVRHALSILGMNKLRNAILGMSITRMWNHVKTPRLWSMSKFNQHSAATALLSDHLAQRLPVVYAEGAFIAGLLHDLGRLLIALGLPDEHDRILTKHLSGVAPMLDCEREILGMTHQELSAEALAMWKLPVEIQNAVREHHIPTDGTSQINTAKIPLKYVLDAANQYVNSTGVLVTEQDKSS